MPDMNSMASQALNRATAKQVTDLGRTSSPSKDVTIEKKLVQNKNAFSGVLQRSASSLVLPAPQEINTKIEQTPSEEMQAVARQAPIPSVLDDTPQKWNQMSNAQLIDTLMQGKGEKGPRYHSMLRNQKELDTSGILKDLQYLVQRNIEVPASELDRTVADDAVLVMRDFAKMDSAQIIALKEKAYDHDDLQDLDAALEMKHYGSDRHKQFGVLVESLTGGIISAEEAMSMNPTGGLPGPNANEVPLISEIPAIARHAMRHDATGFLLSRFGIGPGYGSKTTIFGLSKDNPLAGQILGVAREAFGEASQLPAYDQVTRMDRFNHNV